MKHTLFPQEVRLTDEHKYVDADGNYYMGFSSFYDNFIHKPFNSGAAAYGVAKSKIAKGEPTTAQSVLDEWERMKDLGIKYDRAIEMFTKTGEINEGCEDIADLVREVVEEYKDHHSVYTQVVTYNKDYRVAGSPDKFGISSVRKGATFEMSDFKVFEKGDEDLYKHRGWLNEPLSHLPATKYTKIALQLSYYAFQLEGLTGMRCKKLFIHLINPISETQQKIIVPYLKTDIIVCLEMYKENILSLVNQYTKSEEPIF